MPRAPPRFCVACSGASCLGEWPLPVPRRALVSCQEVDKTKKVGFTYGKFAGGLRRLFPALVGR